MYKGLSQVEFDTVDCEDENDAQLLYKLLGIPRSCSHEEVHHEYALVFDSVHTCIYGPLGSKELETTFETLEKPLDTRLGRAKKGP